VTTAETISTWIVGQVRKAGAEGAVVGLSGGVDSSLTVALARRGLGEQVLGLIMPCHSHPQDMAHAELVAQTFDVRTELTDLTSVFDAFIAVLPEDSRLAQANLKARLRMSTLYYCANLRNYLVMGTSNRSELAVGYFTKFGDGGADLLPLGDLLKTQVWELAREVGVPEPIIEKAPSGGLWPGQTDEGEMGITYREIDDAVRALDEGALHRVPADTVTRVQRMLDRAAHKRTMPPVCPLL
jgi:NAD+ synthase